MQLNNKRKFKSINSVLSKVLEKYDLDHIHILDSIKIKWQTFDKTIAAHSSPVKYNSQSKTLLIKMDNPFWKKEFLINKEVLNVKIKNAFRDINIKNIEII